MISPIYVKRIVLADECVFEVRFPIVSAPSYATEEEAEREAKRVTDLIVGDAVQKAEAKLLGEIADYLAHEGYPWTSNDIRSGAWRKKASAQ